MNIVKSIKQLSFSKAILKRENEETFIEFPNKEILIYPEVTSTNQVQNIQDVVNHLSSIEALQNVYLSIQSPPRKTIQPWIGNGNTTITLPATNFILININRDVIINGVTFRIIDNPGLNLTYALYNTKFNFIGRVVPKDALFLDTLINPVPGVYETTFAPVTIPKGAYYFAQTSGITFHTSGRQDPIMYSNFNFVLYVGVTDGTNPLLTSYPNTFNPTVSPSAGQISFRFFEV
jgi:hypothetical protein